MVHSERNRTFHTIVSCYCPVCAFPWRTQFEETEILSLSLQTPIYPNTLHTAGPNEELRTIYFHSPNAKLLELYGNEENSAPEPMWPSELGTSSNNVQKNLVYAHIWTNTSACCKILYLFCLITPWKIAMREKVDFPSREVSWNSSGKPRRKWPLTEYYKVKKRTASYLELSRWRYEKTNLYTLVHRRRWINGACLLVRSGSSDEEKKSKFQIQVVTCISCKVPMADGVCEPNVYDRSMVMLHWNFVRERKRKSWVPTIN